MRSHARSISEFATCLSPGQGLSPQVLRQIRHILDSRREPAVHFRAELKSASDYSAGKSDTDQIGALG